MTAYDTVGGLRPPRNQGKTLFVAGLLVGIIIGFAVPRIWSRFRGSPPTPTTTVAKPRPNPVQTLQITAQPAQRGLVISAPVPLKMLRTSETERAKQSDRAVFTGFKNWGATMNYLTNGDGNLFIKASDGTTTKWTRPDYKSLLQNKPLSAKIAPGKSYTLFFQRQGRGTVGLGTFSIAAGAPTLSETTEEADAPATEPEPAADDTLDTATEPNAAEDLEEPGEVHDTSELDAADAPVEDAPAREKVIE